MNSANARQTDRSVAKQVQPRREGGRAVLHREEHQREDDPNERNCPGGDGEEHLHGAVARDPEAGANVRHDDPKSNGHGGEQQLDDAGTEPAPSAQHARKLAARSLAPECWRLLCVIAHHRNLARLARSCRRDSTSRCLAPHTRASDASHESTV